MVEMVGIGDAGTLSGTLQISPLHADDVGLVILGSQKATQTGNYLEIRDSTGAVLICADSNGALNAASFVGTMELDPAEDLGIASLSAALVCATTLCSELIYNSTAPGKLGSICITATTASGFTNLYADAVTAARIDAVTAGTAMKIGTTTITGTTASGFTSIYGQTLTATTANVGTVNGTTVSGTTLCAELIYANVAPGKLGTITITATTASGFTSLYAATVTATTASIATVNAGTASAATMCAELMYANVAPGKIGTITVTATTASGFTNLYTSVLTAARIDAVEAGTQMKIGATTVTATTISGATSLYAQTVTATTGGIDAVNAQTVSAATMCAELVYANIAPGKIGTITITATVASGFTNLYTSTLSATTANIATVNAVTSSAATMCAELVYANVAPGKIGAITLTATTASGFTNLYAATVTATTANIGTSNATTVSGTTVRGDTVLVTTELSSMGPETLIKKYNSRTITTTRTVGVCGTTSESITVTAALISIPESSTAFIDVYVTAFCTAGVAAGSAAGYAIKGVATSGGRYCVSTTTPTTAKAWSQEDWIVALVPGGIATTTNVVGLTVLGSANNHVTWGYDVTCVLVTSS